MSSPPGNDEAPACRHGVYPREEKIKIYVMPSVEAIRIAAIALSKYEWLEWMGNILFDLEGVPTGTEDNQNLFLEYLAAEEAE